MPNASTLCTCGANLPGVDGPTHRYMLSTPACWEAYGRVLAREYEDPTRWANHRFTVDAYAVQHPGVDSPQARNSVGIHLSRLALIFERGWPLERANDAMLAITAKKFAYPWLTPPPGFAGVTAVDMLAAETSIEHLDAILRWARAVWDHWTPYHAAVHGWLVRIP